MLKDANNYMRFDLLTAVKVTNFVSWVVKPSQLAGRYRFLGAAYCLSVHP
jgi:hypothetical protein